MTWRRKLQVLTCLIAAVWFINGLFCKVLNLVPRHREIVATILGADYSKILTVVIGFSEIAMAIWILTGYRTRLNAITQMFLIALMNILEVILAPDLLLWGKANALFAFLFILLIYHKEFNINQKPALQF